MLFRFQMSHGSASSSTYTVSSSSMGMMNNQSMIPTSSFAYASGATPAQPASGTKRQVENESEVDVKRPKLDENIDTSAN